MLLIIDKPKSITSYDVIRILKRNFPKRKIGHGGTLDPMATGLLIVGIDKDTKKLWHIQTGPKTYLATIDFSKDSDTRDMDYREKFEQFPLEKAQDKIVWINKNWKSIDLPTQDHIEQKLNTLVPSSILPLTPFSAKKKDGKKFYELARKWEAISETREMRVSLAEITDYKFPTLDLRLTVGGGTYIRSIAHRLGQQFWLWWILTMLRRTKIWDIDIDQISDRKELEWEIKGQKIVLKISWLED